MKMYGFFIFITVIMSSVLYNGCATILTGTHDRIIFDTKPEGAKIFIDGIEKGETPAKIKVERNFSHVSVSFKLDGYETHTIKLKREFNLWALLNLTDPVGWIIDAATGAIFKFQPKGYEIELEIKKPGN